MNTRSSNGSEPPPSLREGLLPLAAFMLTYYLSNLLWATAVLIVAVVVQTAVHWLRHRHLSKHMAIGTGAVVVLGGLTLLMRDPIFIMWKPTVVYWAGALLLLGSEVVGKRNFSERMLGHAIALSERTWRNINVAWGIQMLATGALNLYVAYNYPEYVWVNFKIFGLLGIQIGFFLLLALLVSISRQPTPPDTPQ